jgi:hypothetical protein
VIPGQNNESLASLNVATTPLWAWCKQSSNFARNVSGTKIRSTLISKPPQQARYLWYSFNSQLNFVGHIDMVYCNIFCNFGSVAVYYLISSIFSSDNRMSSSISASLTSFNSYISPSHCFFRTHLYLSCYVIDNQFTLDVIDIQCILLTPWNILGLPREYTIFRTRTID